MPPLIPRINGKKHTYIKKADNMKQLPGYVTSTTLDIAIQLIGVDTNYGPTRVCQVEGCGTILNYLNKGKTCIRHTPRSMPDNRLHRVVNDQKWRTHTPISRSEVCHE